MNCSALAEAVCTKLLLQVKEIGICPVTSVNVDVLIIIDFYLCSCKNTSSPEENIEK